MLLINRQFIQNPIQNSRIKRGNRCRCWVFRWQHTHEELSSAKYCYISKFQTSN